MPAGGIRFPSFCVRLYPFCKLLCTPFAPPSSTTSSIGSSMGFAFRHRVPDLLVKARSESAVAVRCPSEEPSTAAAAAAGRGPGLFCVPTLPSLGRGVVFSMWNYPLNTAQQLSFRLRQLVYLCVHYVHYGCLCARCHAAHSGGTKHKALRVSFVSCCTKCGHWSYSNSGAAGLRVYARIALL